MSEKENQKNNIGTILGLLIVAIFSGVGILYLINSAPDKPDGNVYFYINGEKAFQKHIGHNEVMEFCRGTDKPVTKGHKNRFKECSEVFEGCGAINCRCDFNDGEIAKVYSVLMEFEKK